MCMQCAATATAAMGSAMGIRAAARIYLTSWMTPRRMRAVTVCLLGGGLLLASVTIGGSG